MTYAKIWMKNIPGGGNSKYQGLGDRKS